VKAVLRKVTGSYVKRFRSYDSKQLVSALHELGVVPDAVLMVHSSYSPFSGLLGTPASVVAALQQAIGPGGTLLMLSLPYTASAEEYVKTCPTFDVRRTASRMGFVSEVFRRQKGTLRSRNPAHPILARGPLASWFIEGHERCTYSCGPGSPFEKMVEKDAAVLFFDTPLRYLTFFHYLEHLVSDKLPFSLYDPEGYAVRMIDEAGQESSVSVHPFSQRARAARRFRVLEAELYKRGLVRTRRIGNTSLILVNTREMVAVTKDLASRGRYFYDLDG
jgi:aminoglycoside N3'-acetyltransferase